MHRIATTADRCHARLRAELRAIVEPGQHVVGLMILELTELPPHLRLTGEERSRDLDVRPVFRLPIPLSSSEANHRMYGERPDSKIVAIVERQPTLCTRGVSYAARRSSQVCVPLPSSRTRSTAVPAMPTRNPARRSAVPRAVDAYSGVSHTASTTTSSPLIRKSAPMNGNPGRIALVVSNSVEQRQLIAGQRRIGRDSPENFEPRGMRARALFGRSQRLAVAQRGHAVGDIVRQLAEHRDFVGCESVLVFRGKCQRNPKTPSSSLSGKAMMARSGCMPRCSAHGASRESPARTIVTVPVRIAVPLGPCARSESSQRTGNRSRASMLPLRAIGRTDLSASARPTHASE